MELTFAGLQTANRERGVEWVQDATTKPGLEFATIEMGGETGELLNKVKKYLRYTYGMPGGDPSMEPIADELGDVVICASLLANKLDLDLADCVARKFNKTSDKHGFTVKLPV
jgi:NTP pyrophosphatase (non-canonical NTP hydrolase)